MQSGKLRHRFTIQTYTDALNNYGESVRNWTTFAQRWGSLDAVTGEEEELADKVTGDTTYNIKIRILDGLLGKMRFKLGTRFFNIERILPDRTDNKNQLVRVREKLD